MVLKRVISVELLSRMTLSNITESGGSGRTSIYHDHLIKFFEQPSILRMLFGSGKESCASLLGVASHNTFIDYLWDLGFFGIFIYLIMIIKILKTTWNNSPAFASVCAIIVWSLSISVSNQLIYWVLLYTCICIAKNELRCDEVTVIGT